MMWSFCLLKTGADPHREPSNYRWQSAPVLSKQYINTKVGEI